MDVDSLRRHAMQLNGEWLQWSHVLMDVDRVIHLLIPKLI